MKRPKKSNYVDEDGFDKTENAIDNYVEDLDEYIDYLEQQINLGLDNVMGRDICGCGKPVVKHICRNCKGEIQYS